MWVVCYLDQAIDMQRRRWASQEQYDLPMSRFQCLPSLFTYWKASATQGFLTVLSTTCASYFESGLEYRCYIKIMKILYQRQFQQRCFRMQETILCVALRFLQTSQQLLESIIELFPGLMLNQRPGFKEKKKFTQQQRQSGKLFWVAFVVLTHVLGLCTVARSEGYLISLLHPLQVFQSSVMKLETHMLENICTKLILNFEFGLYYCPLHTTYSVYWFDTQELCGWWGINNLHSTDCCCCAIASMWTYQANHKAGVNHLKVKIMKQIIIQ